MTEYVINMSICKPIKCTVCSVELRNQTVFMMHDKPFCGSKCKEKFFSRQYPSKIKNHLKRTISHNKLPVNIETKLPLN